VQIKNKPDIGEVAIIACFLVAKLDADLGMIHTIKILPLTFPSSRGPEAISLLGQIIFRAS
jgi:hypothetical protein